MNTRMRPNRMPAAKAKCESLGQVISRILRQPCESQLSLPRTPFGENQMTRGMTPWRIGTVFTAGGRAIESTVHGAVNRHFPAAGTIFVVVNRGDFSCKKFMFHFHGSAVFAIWIYFLCRWIFTAADTQSRRRGVGQFPVYDQIPTCGDAADLPGRCCSRPCAWRW